MKHGQLCNQYGLNVTPERSKKDIILYLPCVIFLLFHPEQKSHLKEMHCISVHIGLFLHDTTDCLLWKLLNISFSPWEEQIFFSC